jgi:hypothetical protein
LHDDPIRYSLDARRGKRVSCGLLLHGALKVFELPALRVLAWKLAPSLARLSH